MTKLVLAVLATIVIVVFALSNSHDVDLSFAVGPPIRIRLVFLLLSAFLIGVSVPIFYGLLRHLERDRIAMRQRASLLTLERERGNRDIVG